MRHLSRIARSILTTVGFLYCATILYGQEVVYSGPQVGERISPFRVRGVFDEDAGKDLDLVAKVDGKALLLVFVHDVNRPSIAMVRNLCRYSQSRESDGLYTGLVFLSDDFSEMEKSLQRIKASNALVPNIPTGISIDGKEGPGSYGLNRAVTLTILLAKDSKVVANFALVQPSLQVDLPKVVESIVKLIGGKVPSLESLVEPGVAMARTSDGPDMRSLLQPLIQRSASPEQVDKAAKIIEEKMATDEAIKKEIARISTTIVESGKLENYGIPKAQEFLRKWAKELEALAPKKPIESKRE